MPAMWSMPNTLRRKQACGDPYGTRTRVFAVRGRRPRPLDEGAAFGAAHMSEPWLLVNGGPARLTNAQSMVEKGTGATRRAVRGIQIALASGARMLIAQIT